MADKGNVKIKVGIDSGDAKKGAQEVKNELSGIQKSFKDMGDQMQAEQKKWSGVKAMGESFKKGGEMLTAGLTAPMVGFGAAAVASSMSYDECMDTIAGKTTLAGAELDKMGEALKKAYLDNRQPMDQTAQALTLIYKQTGLNGDAAADLATKYGILADTLGIDYVTAVSTVTELSKAWGLTASEQSSYLDYADQVCKTTNVDFNELTTAVGQNATMFKSMGYSVNDATVLTASLCSQGMGAQDVIAGMSAASRKLATDQKASNDELASANEKLSEVTQKYAQGKASLEDVQKAQEAVTAAEQKNADLMASTSSTVFADYIQKIKDAKTESEANALALEAFGPKGAVFAKAIKDGKMNVEDLKKALGDTTGAIDKAGEATKGPKEEFDKVKKTLEEGLIPAGDAIMRAVVLLLPFITQLANFVAGLAMWFSKLDPTIQTVVVVIGVLVAALGPLLMVLGQIMIAWPVIAGGITAVAGVLGSPILVPIAAVVAALVGLAAVFLWLYDNVEWFRNAVNAQIEGVKTDIQIAVDIISGCIAVVKELLNGDLTGAVNAVGDTWKKVWEDIKQFMNKIGIAESVEKIINSALDAINAFIDGYNSLPDQLKIFGHVDRFGHVTISEKTAAAQSYDDAIKNASTQQEKSMLQKEKQMEMRGYAEGGVFMQPTYLTNSVIAEREPEAIIPLSRLGSMQSQELTVSCPIYLDSNKVGAAITKKIRLNSAI